MPGVMLASAVRDYVVNFAVSPATARWSSPTTTTPTAPRIALKEAGLEVPAILDARDERRRARCSKRARALGIRVETGRAIAKVKGGKRVTGVAICLQAGEGAVLEEIACDAVAMSGGWSPVVHLWSAIAAAS